MKKRSWVYDSVIVGLALFSTMFGAGNLIFPPQVGLASGTAWVAGAIGIVLTGVILPVTAFWSVNNVGQDVKCMMGYVHPKFYSIFYLISCILVGVGSTLPRSAATTHEMAIAPLFPNVPIWVTMIVFFALVWFFANDKNAIVDKLGKFLTPLLLLAVAIVLVKGVISPMGKPVDTGITSPLTSSMLTGYLTGDLTVGLMCANIFIGGLLLKDHKEDKDRKKCGLLAGLISVTILGIIYVVLTYMGACSGEHFDLSTPQTTLLTGIIQGTLGKAGMACMGIAVGLACLTTVIGLIGVGGDLINEVSKGKISYKVAITVMCIVGAGLGSFGVQKIVDYVTPIFLVMYPICIVFTFLGFINKWLPNDGAYKGGILFAGIVSLGDAILVVAPGLTGLAKVMSFIPLYEYGFAWLIPAIIGMIIGTIVCKGKPRYHYDGSCIEAPVEEAK